MWSWYTISCMSFTKEDIDKLAHLARLHLSSDEEERFADQLSSILDYVQKIQDVEVTSDHDAFHLSDIAQVVREDVVSPCEDADTLLTAASQREGRFIKVQPVRDAR